MHKLKPRPHNSGEEPRRSKRFPVVVPVEVAWAAPEGARFREAGQARQVNAQGGLLQLKTYPEVGSRVELTNLLSRETVQARVLAMRHSGSEVLGVALELVVPSESFWGVNFQLKRTNAELFKLEQALRSGGIDLRVLREFLDAVDCIRTTAGAVEELQHCKLQGQDADRVFGLLTAERIRRATYLCNELASDLEGGNVALQTDEIRELYRAVTHVYQTLRLLRKEDRESRHELATRR